MRCEFVIQPRQTGKTTELIEQYNNCDVPCCFVVNKLSNMKRIKQEVINKINVITYYELIDEARSLNKKYKHIFIDEYLFFPKDVQQHLYVFIPGYFPDAMITIKSTASELINKDLFKLIRLMKKEKIDLNDLPVILYKQMEYLYYNFLTDPNTNIILRNDKMRSDLSYRTEV